MVGTLDMATWGDATCLHFSQHEDSTFHRGTLALRSGPTRETAGNSVRKLGFQKTQGTPRSR